MILILCFGGKQTKKHNVAGFQAGHVCSIFTCYPVVPWLSSNGFPLWHSPDVHSELSTLPNSLSVQNCTENTFW